MMINTKATCNNRTSSRKAFKCPMPPPCTAVFMPRARPSSALARKSPQAKPVANLDGGIHAGRQQNQEIAAGQAGVAPGQWCSCRAPAPPPRAARKGEIGQEAGRRLAGRKLCGGRDALEELEVGWDALELPAAAACTPRVNVKAPDRCYLPGTVCPRAAGEAKAAVCIACLRARTPSRRRVNSMGHSR